MSGQPDERIREAQETIDMLRRVHPLQDPTAETTELHELHAAHARSARRTPSAAPAGS